MAFKFTVNDPEGPHVVITIHHFITGDGYENNPSLETAIRFIEDLFDISDESIENVVEVLE